MHFLKEDVAALIKCYMNTFQIDPNRGQNLFQNRHSYIENVFEM